jgi:hypothetical protein
MGRLNPDGTLDGPSNPGSTKSPRTFLDWVCSPMMTRGRRGTGQSTSSLSTEGLLGRRCLRQEFLLPVGENEAPGELLYGRELFVSVKQRGHSVRWIA